jgi:hypothetical protein
MHKIEYTTIAKLILRASKKVNGGHNVASARWSLAMRGRELTALLENIRDDSDNRWLSARSRVTLSVHPNSICKFSLGHVTADSVTKGGAWQAAGSQKHFARSFNVRLDHAPASWWQLRLAVLKRASRTGA